MKPKVDPLLEYAEVARDASGQASSPRYGDIYASRAGALGQARGVYLQGCGLLDTPPRWAGREQFTVLETGFGLGVNFLATWAAWRADPQRCARLDYVSLELHPVRAADLLRGVDQPAGEPRDQSADAITTPRKTRTRKYATPWSAAVAPLSPGLAASFLGRTSFFLAEGGTCRGMSRPLAGPSMTPRAAIFRFSMSM